MDSQCKVKQWTGRIVTVLAVLPFILSCFMKFKGGSEVLEGLGHLGWEASSLITLGILEAICIVFYLLPPTMVLGAILLTGYLGGAISAHVRIGESVVTHIVIGILIWLALFLRESKLQELLPVRAKEFRYEREMVIHRSSDVIFAYLKLLKNFKNWNPFLKKDPHAKTEYRGTDGEVGFVASWVGNRDLGAGEQEIIKIVDGKRIDFELRFAKPFKATHFASFVIESMNGNQTKVKWIMTGKSSFPMNLIGLLMNCEKMVGNDFTDGLKQLKVILEK